MSTIAVPAGGGTLLLAPPMAGRLQLARGALIGVAVVAVSLLLQLTVVSALQSRSAQQGLFDRFRGQLAQGTAPTGPADGEGRALRSGAPVAYLEIPSIGLRQVIVEGTSSAALTAGPGHRRDTPLPGQAGVSVVFGRRSAYGGPFGRLRDLRSGDEIRVTTGQGTFDYEVRGLRRDGDRLPPPPAAGKARLVLTTADGRPYLPSGVIRIDADLDDPDHADGVPQGAPRAVTSANLPAAEQTMAADPGRLWALALWLQLLVALVVLAVAAWHRWGRAEGWIVFAPPLVLVGLATSNQAAALLPNLL